MGCVTQDLGHPVYEHFDLAAGATLFREKLRVWDPVL
jgi:hypothetical protein